jgi:hypothetical protein
MALFTPKAIADGAAGTQGAESVLGTAPNAASTVVAVRFSPAASLTADNTNYATLFVYRRAASNQAQTTIASVITQITGSGNWTAWKEVDLTLSNTALTANDVITYAITKTGTGVVVPAGNWQVLISIP